MNGFLEMMAAPVVMALVLVAMHSHLGYHVVRRGVIFVDIALAQIAAFGVAVAPTPPGWWPWRAPSSGPA